MMILASSLNEVWVNPTYVVSFEWGEYKSIVLHMINGKEVIVPRGKDSVRVYNFLTSKVAAQ